MKFGLIGYPTSHSLSPSLFKAGYGDRYSYELIEEENFEKAYQRFIDGDFKGINVTAPFKELALQKADILSEECRLTGATNLMVKTPEGIKAYNSDFLGVRLWLSEVDQRGERTPPTLWVPPPAARGVARFLPSGPPRMARVLIIGLGGAGKAAKAAAESLGMETVLMNRTQYSDEVKPLSQFREEFRKAGIIIYNLPVRIPELDLLTDEDISSGKPKHILEANYRDPAFDNTLILNMRRANPAITYTDGKVWLMLQAVTGYKIFTGEVPDERAMKDIIKTK